VDEGLVMFKTVQLPLTLLLFFWASWAGAASGELTCTSANVLEFRKIEAVQTSKRLVFFASWCRSCMDHMDDFSLGEDLLVISFDEKQASEEALISLGYGGAKKKGFACYFDKDGSIAEYFGVTSLPARVPIWKSAKP
jgi:hypothetical protein